MTVTFHSTAAQLLDDATKVHPYENNPRNGDTDAIVESIRENGCYRPIYAWAKDGTILAGNHTYAALLELGCDQVPIAWIEAPDLNAARKIVLADNRTADQGRYDEAILLAELDALEGDLAGTGYEPDDVESLRALLDDETWDPNRAGNDPGAGDPDEEAFLPRIDLRVTARVFDAWRLFLDAQDGENDAVKLERALADAGLLL